MNKRNTFLGISMFSNALFVSNLLNLQFNICRVQFSLILCLTYQFFKNLLDDLSNLCTLKVHLPQKKT